jgi:hypothetical protein
MAEKESTTPLYDKHKKIHELVHTLKRLPESDYVSAFGSDLHAHVSNYLHSKKDAKTGKVHWEKVGGEKEHRKFTDGLWDKAADYIAKNHLKLSDGDIKKLKDIKTRYGSSHWENMMSHYMGGMDRDAFFKRFQNRDEMSVNEIMQHYVGALHESHSNELSSELLKRDIKEPEDMDMVASYLANAKKHNPESLKAVRARKKLKSLEDAMNVTNTLAHSVPDKYHPDRKETFY